MPSKKSIVALVPVIALLLITAIGVALAAPRPAARIAVATATSASGTPAVAPRTNLIRAAGVGDTPVATDQPAATQSALPTATAATQPTDTPALPTATVAPMQTPAPSWHVLANYSGTTGQTLPGFTTADPWRMDWTCTPGTPDGSTSFGFTATVDGAGLAGFGNICATTMATSGAMTVCATPVPEGNACYGSHTYIITESPDTQPQAPWAATVSVWY